MRTSLKLFAVAVLLVEIIASGAGVTFAQTLTPTDIPTNTPVPPTGTPTDIPTNTPVPPTGTPTDIPTNTPVPPTGTPTDIPTNTPVPPTGTPTDIPTNTPVPPTGMPTDIPTSTPVPPTGTPITATATPADVDFVPGSGSGPSIPFLLIVLVGSLLTLLVWARRADRRK